MLIGIRNFFHHLFNPHCAECRNERNNPTIDILRELLFEERRNNQRLLDRILFVPEEAKEEIKERPQPIGKKFTPWNVRRTELERADKERADSLIAEKKQILPIVPIEDLERELGVINASE